jgi:hypothetical protein
MYGMTLVETMIYAALLSLLISNAITFFYTAQENNKHLLHDIERSQSGFIATTVVVLLSIGVLLFIVVTNSAAALYLDAVDREGYRFQKSLNAAACQDTLLLLRAKDYFLEGPVELADLGCVINK